MSDYTDLTGSDELSTSEYAGVGTASLSNSLNSVGNGDPFSIHGVAIGVDDVTYGQSSKVKIWPAETLEQAAESLTGRPLVVDHENTSAGTIGKVTKAKFTPGVGVVYEAQIAPHYEELAKDVQAGMLDVSPRILHRSGEHLERNEKGALIVEPPAKFDNLSIVSSGAAPSNFAEAGDSPYLNGDSPSPTACASMSQSESSEMSTAVLSRTIELPSDEEVLDQLGESNTGTYSVSADDWVQWYDDDGPEESHGKVEDVDDGDVTITVWEQEDEGIWHPTASTKTVREDEVEGWGNYPTDDAISNEELAVSVVDTKPVSQPDSYDSRNENPSEWSEGDMVQWEVRPDLFGRVVHVDTDKHVVMVEIHEMSGDGLESVGRTLTAAYTDVEEYEGRGVEEMASDARKKDGDGRTGSDKNEDGSASSKDNDISVSENVKSKLESKRDEHNEKYDADSKTVTLGMLKAVYRRGAGAYSSSHREGMTRNQWAMARVNAFLYLVRNGNPENDNYTQDNDLLPDGHKRASSASENAEGVPDDVAVAELSGYDVILSGGVEELASMDGLDDVYSDWNSAVNMTASQLRKWAKNPCAKEASVDPRAVIERNLKLLEANKSDWGTQHIEDAKRTISFIARMSASENEPESPMDGVHGCPTEWAISLLNWAYNPFDSLPDHPDDGELSDAEGYDELAHHEDTSDDEDSSYSEMDNHDDLYDSKSAAQDRAGEIGCVGTHEHGDKYMPCASMDAYDEAIESESDEMSDVAEELATDYEMQEPTYEGKTSQEWDRPTLSDFLEEMDSDADSFIELSSDKRDQISSAFYISQGGFPPQTYGDLKLPVVETSGELNVNALEAVKGGRGVSAVDGLSSEMEEKIVEHVDMLASKEFDRNWSETSEEASQTVALASIRHEQTASGPDDARVATLSGVQTMVNIEYTEAGADEVEELSEPVVVERDEVEQLKEQAEQADEVTEELSGLRDEFGEISDAREALDGLDDESVEMLREGDAVVIDETEFEELSETNEEAGRVYADALAEDVDSFDAEELMEKYSPFELREKVEESETASLSPGDVVTEGEDPEPKAGTAEAEELSSSEEGEESPEVEELRENYALSLENQGWDRQAKRVREGELAVPGLDE